MAEGIAQLDGGWVVYKTLPGQVDSPQLLEQHEVCFKNPVLPGSLHHAVSSGQMADDGLDGFDWWYCCDFSLTSPLTNDYVDLRCERLASLADVWLNNQLIHSQAQFFDRINVDVSSLLGEDNVLCICFRSIANRLQQKKPRPRWKTNLVEHQQLRWLRSSLLGRIPGWAPSFAPLGPCGDIELRGGYPFKIEKTDLSARLENKVGVVQVTVQVKGFVDSLHLSFGDECIELCPQPDSPCRYVGQLKITDPVLWWPHTHGQPHLYAASLRVTSAEHTNVLELGKRGFCQIALSDTNGFNLCVNDQPVFLRGACWTIADIERFWADDATLKNLLVLARDAGMNMLRVGGTMQYEQESFYRLCNELGILVWQDFMFANMDYPVDDADFLNTITKEVAGQLERLSAQICIAVYCGNSEVQQQASMMGLEKSLWSNVFFDQQLPDLCEQYHPGIVYFPSTPCGGALPFHLNEGITHFYGVGAYKRSLLASGLDKVKFTAETLGFSHVPEDALIEKIFNGSAPMCHSPKWKMGVPRDGGAGWDFEDIRDHYFKEQYSIDPVQLRSVDTKRYLSLSRVLTGEILKNVFSCWRSSETPCRGALVWFYKDIMPGAGWGVIDSEGTPKAAYYYLKRILQPLTCCITDQGLDGLHAVVINETQVKRSLTINIQFIKTPRTAIEQYTNTIEVEPFSQWQANIESLLGHFRDSTFSYKFGPLQHDVVSLNIQDSKSGDCLSGDCFFVDGLLLPMESNVNVSFQYGELDDGRAYVDIASDTFLQSAAVMLTGVTMQDCYFHIIPGQIKRCFIREGASEAAVLKGYLSAVNLSSPVRIKMARA